MAEERIASNDGVRIAYEVHRQPGAPWAVFVHGLGYPRQAWGPVIGALDGRLSPVLIDNRGIGGSDVPDGPYDAAQMAGDVLAVLDDLGLERTHVVGTSLGGMIAQELAITAPRRVDRLALVATTPGGDAAAPIPEPTQRLLAEAPRLDPQEALRRLIANALGPDADPAIVEEVLQLRTRTAQSPIGWQGQAAAGTTYDGAGRAATIEAPTLLLQGTHDAVIDPTNASSLDELLPDSRLVWLERAGHLSFWERPREVADRIVEHLTADGPSDHDGPATPPEG